MDRTCQCGKIIPYKVTVNGVERQLKNRRFCLDCSPFRHQNHRDIVALLAQPRRTDTERFRRWQEKARRERKARLVALLGDKCWLCGYDRCIAALEFHHRDPKTKLFNLGKDNLLKRWELVVTEAMKCDLLCANCHRELEDELRRDALADDAAEGQENVV